jgi:hypothetical protein
MENRLHDHHERINNSSNVFLQLGCQYYGIARYCALDVFTLPVCGTVFHHAVEMLIKGYLIKMHPLTQLKEAGHNLSELWSMLKSNTGDTKLSRYDKTITDLDQFGELRYPERMVDEGFFINARLGVTAPAQIPDTMELPHYTLIVSDLDEIALAVLNACNVNPKAGFKNAPTEFVRALPASLRPYD